MEGEEEDQVEKIGEYNMTKERSVQRNALEGQTISWGTDTVSTQKVNERNTDYVIELVNSFGSHKRSNEDVDRSNSLMSQIFSYSMDSDTEDSDFFLDRATLSKNEDGKEKKDVKDEDISQLEKNTKCFGLTFQNRIVEKSFMNEFAILHRRTVYAGYTIQIIAGALLIMLVTIFDVFQHEICKKEETCEILFGPPVNFDFLQKLGSFNGIISIFGILLISVGTIVHYCIHSSNRIQNKLWALVATNAIYLIEIVFIMANLTFNRCIHDLHKFWALKLFLWYLVIVMISVYFTGLLFKQNAINFVAGTALFYGLSLPIALMDYNNIPSHDPSTDGSVFAFAIYITTAPMITLLHLVMLISSYINEQGARRRFVRKLMLTHQQDKIIQEKTKNENFQRELLDNILPAFVVDQLELHLYNTSEEKLRSLSQRHQGVSIMFADIVNFTQFAAEVDSASVMIFLNEIFHKFDNLCDQFNVYKIETVGDCYVAAVGIVTGQQMSDRFPIVQRSVMKTMSQCKAFCPTVQGADADVVEQTAASNTHDIITFAKAVRRVSRKVVKPEIKTGTLLRIGVHTGACMSGIVGTKNLRFCLFGDTMNTAARMQQSGIPDFIHASDLVVSYTPHENWKLRGTQYVKGKGEMETYILQ